MRSTSRIMFKAGGLAQPDLETNAEPIYLFHTLSSALAGLNHHIIILFVG